MKGLALASLAFLLLVVGSAITLRFYRGNKEFKVFLGAFAAAVLGYAAVFPPPPPALFFLGFWCFAYFACLSPSMGVMVELRARGERGISAEEALAMQGREEPVNLIFQRRLPKLVQGGYVREEGGAYRLLPRGGRIAALGAFLKRLINSEAPVAGSRTC